MAEKDVLKSLTSDYSTSNIFTTPKPRHLFSISYKKKKVGKLSAFLSTCIRDVFSFTWIPPSIFHGIYKKYLSFGLTLSSGHGWRNT
jgi:hypothetical protein